MKLIINSLPDDWDLAIRAARKLIAQTEHDSWITRFSDGTVFLVKKNKASVSVIADTKNAP